METTKINIIGRGNVATHLWKAFQAVPDVYAVIINPHTLEGLDKDADVTIISVSDNAINDVLSKLPPTSSIIAHTSGSTPIGILSGRQESTGVFYPFQTFSKDKELDYDTIPFFIEASDPQAEETLLNLASRISKKIYRADSKKRKAMHVAGVFACNFANHLWSIADDILRANGMNFEVLRPLLQETLRKTETMSPFDGQTGPAVRSDSKTINSHLEFLDEQNSEQDVKEIYKLLSASIAESHSDSRHNK